MGRVIRALVRTQDRIKHVTHDLLGITLPGMENIRQAGKSPAAVLAAETLYPERPVGGQGLMKPFGVNGIKAPAYQTETTGGMAERTLPGPGKMNSFTFYEIFLDFSRKSD
jgi:hypothetical protein